MTGEADLSGRRVLVVEDDYYQAADAARALRGAGAEVMGPCPTMEAALTELEEHIRREAAPSCSPLAALRSSDAVRSSRVIDTAAPIDAAPLKGQHRVRVSLIWESRMSHSFGPLVSVGVGNWFKSSCNPAVSSCQPCPANVGKVRIAIASHWESVRERASVQMQIHSGSLPIGELISKAGNGVSPTDKQLL